MNSKFRYYCDLSEQTAKDIIAKRGNWMNFLDSAAKMYKYNFSDQLLIHAQRPGAIACAPIELWNKDFERWVIPGTKGIALIDDTGSRPRLRYVFDVNDTHVYKKNAPQVSLWQLKEEHKPLVLAVLAKIYDDVDSDSIAKTFNNIASQMAAEYYEDNRTEIGFRLEGSFLEDLDEDNRRAAFIEAVSASMAYLMMSRTGFDTEEYFSEDDFNHISSFNTPDIIHFMGEAVSDLSQQVLRDVELVVKKYERQRTNELAQNPNNERNVENEHTNITIPEPTAAIGTEPSGDHSRDDGRGIRSSGGLSSAEHTTDGGTGREAAGQVRNDEESLSERPPQSDLRADAVQGNPVPALQGSGGAGRETPASSDNGNIVESDFARQGTKPDGLDSRDEHHQSPSGGIGASRTDLRRDLEENESSSQIGTNFVSAANVTEVETDEAELPPISENLAQSLSTSSITTDEVDSILRDGGNAKNSILRITAHFSKDLPIQTNADYLRDEYLHGRYKYHRPHVSGKGFQFGNDRTSIWWNEDGIKIGRGDSALYAHDSVLITWEQAAERIKQLYDTGHYVNHDVLDEALHNEHFELAEDLLHLYRDDFSGYAEMPENWGYPTGGWPDTVERITGLLKDRGDNGNNGEFQLLLEKLREDVTGLENTDVSINHWHNPQGTLKDFEKMNLSAKGFPAVDIQSLNAMRFITGDEINNYLTKGSNISESKMRIFSYFLHDHTPKERIDFLKDEYGHGGGTWVESGDGWHNATPGKGITLQRKNCEDINLNWNAVSKRISELIQSGRYMSDAELSRLHSYETLILARQIKRFFEALPMEERYQSPFAEGLDFYYPRQEEWEVLRSFMEDNAQIDACLDRMGHFFSHTPEDDKYYDVRKTAFANLTAYRNNEYTLFPDYEKYRQSASVPAALVAQTPQQSVQMNLFEASPFPMLPSAAEQQAVIEQKDLQADLWTNIAAEVEVETDIVGGGDITVVDDEADLDDEAAVDAILPEKTESNIPVESHEITEPLPVSATEQTPSEPMYKPGDIFLIEDKQWEIERLDDTDFVYIKNLGTPSAFAVFDHAAVPKDDFESMLAEGKVQMVLPELLTEPAAEEQTQEPLAENVPWSDALRPARAGIPGGSTILAEEISMSPRLKAITDSTPHMPLDWASNIVLYQIGDFYEAYNENADILAERLGLSVIADSSDPDTPLRFVSFPLDKLAEYSRKFHENSTRNFIISNALSDGTRDITNITHPFNMLSGWERHVRNIVTGGAESYTEPFVVIQDSESPNFASNEHMTFTEADKKFKAVEAVERAWRVAEGKSGGYHKTNGAVFYKEYPDDTELSAYEFRYDIGDYEPERSGLYNHINNFWTTAQERLNREEYTSFTQEEIDGVRNGLISILADYRHLEQAPEAEQQAAEPQVIDAIEEQSAEFLLEPELLTSPPPVFFVDWDEAQSDFALNLYQDGDIIGYNKDGVETKLGRMGSLTYITTTGAFWGSNTVPGNIYEQIEAYRNGEVTGEQVRENYLGILETFQSQKSAPIAEPPNPAYGVGDIVNVNDDDTIYIIKAITDSQVQLRDVRSTEGISISRHMNTEDFEQKYSLRSKATSRAIVPETEQSAESETTEVPQPIAEKVYEETIDGDAHAYYLMHYPDNPEMGAVLDLDTLALIQEPAYKYVLCAEACFVSVDGLANYNMEFRKLPRDWNLLPEAVQRQIRIIRPEYERQWNDAYGEKQPQPHYTVAPVTRVEIIDAPITDTQTAPQPISPNFRITDEILSTGGPKTRFRANMDAIHLLNDLAFDNRNATSDEQKILSKYIGWGSLPEAFDESKANWKDEYYELLTSLSPEEYESAKGSVLNAHYTSPTVIKAIYETVERLGFSSGNLLEPAMGTGNFFGLLPESMANAKLYGVELDSVTARIAKQLYPNATIKEMGYEKTDYPDSFFDVAVGNVPFGGYGVHDKRYDKHKFMIHDYFFGKTLDQVRPGGIIAFVTSKGTMDKQNPEVRKYIAQRAELLGAVRLPNTAFKANAGTEVTSDIIFLQKRDSIIDINPDDPKFDWVHLGQTENGIPVNRYFADNPEMILGTMSNDSGMRMYGSETSTTCVPHEGADLAEQLKSALVNVQGQIAVPELDDLDGQSLDAIPADPNVKNFSFTVVDDRVYFRENSMMHPVEQPATTLERIKGMIALRDCVRELIDIQMDEFGIGGLSVDIAIKNEQRELNTLYDNFTKEFGLINASANNRAFATGQFSDNAYYLLCSLEILDEDGKFQRKGDMFTKRTIKQKTIITHVDTASEALAVSLGEKARVDMEYMSQLTGKDEETLFNELRGVIYAEFDMDVHYSNDKVNHIKSIDIHTYRTADEFLSGNIREKLKKYADALSVLPTDSPHYSTMIDNVAALEKAMPKELEAHEINLRLGSTWIDAEIVQQFMYNLLKTSWHSQSIYKVKYHAPTGEWQVSGKGKAQYSDIHATVTYGTKRMNAYEIFADTLNLKDARVYDYKIDADGKQTRELNKKETMLAQQKQEQIKQTFKEWIFKDPDRRERLVKQYNEKFNSIRPREYDGSHITFSGMSPEIAMRKHQVDAVARGLYGGNALFAHEVGAGKTFVIVATAMESKRLGLSNKSLIAVPNHLTEQWASEWLRLYPSANILVATKKDFEMRNRKRFIAKIATGDYDAVIIGHTQLEKIPLSVERQQHLLWEQINEIEDGIREVEASKGDRFTVKQLTKTKKSLEARLSKLMNGKKRDDVIEFEQLGIDRLYIDESHYFKNLALYSKMRNVAGLNNSDAQKSSDLFMKTRYLDELTTERHGYPRGVCFATGTPVSNSIAELYTIQRYLQYDLLIEKDLTHFDAWASTFCEPQTSIELSPEGTGYRARTRLATFHNLPELMSMFKEVADIQTADTLNLPVPKANFETVIAEPSDMQREMVQQLSERATAVQKNLVDKRVDNMLKITTDGRKIGLDQRLMNPLLEDFEGSKINAATENVFRIWEETAENRLTQLVFSDFSTPNKDGRFNIYDDIRDKLIEKGAPEHEVEFIHNADSESKKKELFAKVRQGKVRVLFGSTAKMGAGTNCQDRLIAIHDVDCPWRPADLSQRAGRIVRQGNMNEEVNIYRYATSQTFDSYLWQTVEAKQKFIAQIMTSKSPVRSCEDVDETALSYAEIKALCAGNPLIAEKMNLDIDVARLRMLKADYQSQCYRLEDDLLKHYPKLITGTKERIAGLENDIKLYEKHNADAVNVQMLDGSASVTAKFAGMTIADKTFTEKEPAAKALLEVCKAIKSTDKMPIGEYMGFAMSLQFDSFSKNFHLSLKGSITHNVELGTDAFGNITRINNALSNLPVKLTESKEALERIENQQQAAKTELDKPFALADELAEKELKLAELNTQLNIGSEANVVESVEETDIADDDIDIADGEGSPKMSGAEFLKNIGEFNAGKRTDLTGHDEDIAV